MAAQYLLPPSDKEIDLQAVALLHQRNWKIPMVVAPPCDNLKALIGYCEGNLARGYLVSANRFLDAREISTAFYLGNGPAETPYTRHILPMTQNVPSVRCAVAATASCHLANRLRDNDLKTQSLQLRLKATELLRHQLINDSEGPDLDGLACMMLLAQLDVCTHKDFFQTLLTDIGDMFWRLS